MKKRCLLLIGALILITSCDRVDLSESVFEVRVKNSSLFELKDINVMGGEFTTLSYGNLSSNTISIYKTLGLSVIKVRFEYNDEIVFINSGEFGNVGTNFNNDDIVTINIYYSEQLGFQAEYLDE